MRKVDKMRQIVPRRGSFFSSLFNAVDDMFEGMGEMFEAFGNLDDFLKDVKIPQRKPDRVEIISTPYCKGYSLHWNRRSGEPEFTYSEKVCIRKPK